MSDNVLYRVNNKNISNKRYWLRVKSETQKEYKEACKKFNFEFMEKSFEKIPLTEV